MTSAVWLRKSASVLIVVALAAGCTGDDEPVEPEKGNGDVRVVEHRYGETEIEGTPERVVSLGLTDADPLLALGTQPIAVRPGYGVDGVGPWAADELTSKPARLSPDTINVKRVAALEPDLIVAISAEVDRSTYNRLSKIAPTVVRPKGAVDYGVSWEVATTMVGAALDRVQEAKKIVEKTKVAISNTARANPRIDGTTGEVVRANPSGGWYVYNPVDARGQFMVQLGVNLPKKLARRDSQKRYWIDVAQKRTDQLEADAIVAVVNQKERKAFEKNKRFQNLSVNQRGSVIYVPTEPTGQALAYTTVLSIPYALDRLAPRLSEALD